MEISDGLRDARSLTASWREEYTIECPDSALGSLPPAWFARARAAFASARASP
jgi:hypothetical protein